MPPGSVRNYFKHSKSYKIAGNLALLLIALAFCAVMMFLVYFDKPTSKIDSYIVNQYFAYYQGKEQKALQAIKQGNNEVIKNVLMDDFVDIKKRDRVYPLKRKLLLVLAEALYKQKSFNELLYWSRIWYALDERDVTAMAYYYAALWYSPAHDEEARKKLKEARIRFPKNPVLEQLNHAIATE